ncbi:hypothetical protein A374_08639 [Fictibacillus macauensis ZFHKF-1]|uniref:Uncharacterized protein n=1 Tax=Fictibacillus macauensis ZFHKF-1 TaxID=1196324 RepID=I8AK12_9BACL|nr:hypothetical protein [Fictibacillus macauensis]EIT85889.1 hypothetical protein A374_08639 [Fictibacillus macauensis ZFHKF-1]
MMRRTESIKFSEFMSGEYKTNRKEKRRLKTLLKGASVGLAAVPFVGAPMAFASDGMTMPQAMPVNAVTDWTADKMTEMFTHMLHPILELLKGLSLPVASVMILAKIFLLMFGKTEECWNGIAKVSIAYVLIQLSPFFLDILQELGKAVH